MLKTLIKKQFSELFSIYFRSGTRKKKTSKGIVMLVTIIVLLSMFGFYGMAELLGSAMYNTPTCWLFFLVFSSMALLVSTIVNIFISSSLLYKAKDNSLLLSLPIPPRLILLSRISVLYFNCAIFTSAIWIPISINYFIHVNAPIFSVINIVLLLFVLPLICLSISSLLGFLVSLITMKKGITRILGLFLMALLVIALIFVRVSTKSSMDAFMSNLNEVSNSVQSLGYPVQAIGLAATGDILSMIVVLAISLIVFFIVYFIMSKSFINLITSSKGGKKAVYKRRKSKKSSLDNALLKKELLLFWGTPTYMINSGLGVAIMLIGLVVAIWQAEFLRQFIPLLEVVPEFGNAIPICIVSAVSFIAGLDAISTPSVSLEGRRNIWILHSLPVAPYKPLLAKTKLHVIINGIPSVLLVTVLCIIFQQNVLIIILSCLTTLSFITLSGIFGTFISIKRANLDWISIVVPIKQNIGVLFSILFAFILTPIICVFGVFVNTYIYMPIVSIIMLLFSYIINRWLKNKGAKKFASL